MSESVLVPEWRKLDSSRKWMFGFFPSALYANRVANCIPVVISGDVQRGISKLSVNYHCSSTWIGMMGLCDDVEKILCVSDVMAFDLL